MKHDGFKYDKIKQISGFLTRGGIRVVLPLIY